MGKLLLLDVPQEVRTRLWFLLLQNPALVEPLKVKCVSYRSLACSACNACGVLLKTVLPR